MLKKILNKNFSFLYMRIWLKWNYTDMKTVLKGIWRTVMNREVILIELTLKKRSDVIFNHRYQRTFHSFHFQSTKTILLLIFVVFKWKINDLIIFIVFVLIFKSTKRLLRVIKSLSQISMSIKSLILVIDRAVKRCWRLHLENATQLNL